MAMRRMPECCCGTTRSGKHAQPESRWDLSPRNQLEQAPEICLMLSFCKIFCSFLARRSLAFDSGAIHLAHVKVNSKTL